MLIRIPLSKLREESPNFSLIRMENVSAVGVNVDGVFVKVIETVSADVVFSVNDNNIVRLF